MGIVRGQAIMFQQVIGRAALCAVLLVLGTVGHVSAQTNSYRVQSGDLLEVVVWQDSRLNRAVRVRPDGNISFPLAGSFRAQDLTVSQVEGALKARLQPKYREDLDVTVLLSDVGELAEEEEEEPETFYITGQVRSPGVYEVADDLTVVQAIALSGGFDRFAAKRRVTLNRDLKGEKIQFVLNLRDYERGQDFSADMPVKKGDVIIVPERGLFR